MGYYKKADLSIQRLQYEYTKIWLEVSHGRYIMQFRLVCWWAL